MRCIFLQIADYQSRRLLARLVSRTAVFTSRAAPVSFAARLGHVAPVVRPWAVTSLRFHSELAPSHETATAFEEAAGVSDALEGDRRAGEAQPLQQQTDLDGSSQQNSSHTSMTSRI
jgi:hypothetical protein